MRSDLIKDERVLSEITQIQSKVYKYVIYALAISVIIQQFFLKAPFAQYAAEVYILFGSIIISMVYRYTKGINLYDVKTDDKKKLIGNSLVVGCIYLVIFSMLSGENRLINLILSFVFFEIFYIGTKFLLSYIYNKKEKRINSELDDI